jgi:hypothetical protein
MAIKPGSYVIRRNYGGCRGYAVVGAGGIHGCHTTRASAANQQRAIYAATAKALEDEIQVANSKSHDGVNDNTDTQNNSSHSMEDCNDPNCQDHMAMWHDKKKKDEAESNTLKSDAWEGEPLYNMLSQDEQAFADSLLKLAEEVGPLDQSEGIWIGYEDSSNNQNAQIGVKCGNCALHKSAVACAIISQPIEENGACRLAVIPDGYVNSDGDNMDQDMDNELEMSKASSVRVGQMVSWNSSGGTARGKVVRVVRNGSINVPNSDFTITGTPDNPAALIRIYRDGKPTDTLVGHRVDTLSISSSKSHDGNNNDVIGNDNVPNKKPHSMQDCNDKNCPEHHMGKKDYSDRERQILARRDMALPDGSFPIVTVADLNNAIQSVGRASNYSKARNHIIRRAEALNRTDLLPEEWKSKKAQKAFEVTKRDVSDIDLKPTESMASNAKRGLELRAKFGRGGTAVGVARARDLSNRTNLSPETVARMYSFFSRHEVDKQGKDWDNAERPSNGKIAWLLWGGDSGFAWSTQKWEAIQNARASKSDDTWTDSPFSFYK